MLWQAIHSIFQWVLKWAKNNESLKVDSEYTDAVLHNIIFLFFSYFVEDIDDLHIFYKKCLNM